MRCVPVLALLLLAAPATAQSGLPRGSDDVLLARLYRRSEAGIDAIGRMGLVLSGKSVTRALQVPGSDGRSSLTFSLTADRKRDGARATWELAGAGSAAGTGRVEVMPGALTRVSVTKTGDGEIFASLEAGRASTFDVGKLAQHFGAMPPGMPPTGTPSAPPPPPTMMAAQVAPVAVPRGPGGPSMELQCSGGGAFELSLDGGRGECRTRFDDGGTAVGATCDDGAGSAAEVDCRLAKGRGACVRTAGSGRCREMRP